MASVKLRLKSKKGLASIYVRFINGRQIDLEISTGLTINPAHWDAKNQKIRNLIEIRNRDALNTSLAKLKIFIIDEFNLSFSTGSIINGTWLEKTVSNFFKRPAGESKNKIEPRLIYYSDFATWWLTEKAPKYKVAANKYMGERTIMHYEKMVENIIKFEGNKKIELRNFTSEMMDEITLFLTSELKYAEATTKRMMNRFKFMFNRAEEEGIEVSKKYKAKVFIEKKDDDVEFKPPYLNEDEINRIFKLDLSYDKELDSVRDNLIIGLWTGLRVSDFLNRLKIDNVNDKFIEIKTMKTGHYVSIPIHPQIEAILRKRKGNLPPKVLEQKFNLQIKKIGRIADIDDNMLGAVVVSDKKTKIKRRVVGMYPKYKLITSHICRRSFCTNLFGKVPNKVIMDVAGWKSEKQMLDYNKATNRDSAIALQKHWEKNL